MDFMGVNFYTRTVYQACAENGFAPVDMVDAPKTDIGWEIYPQAFTDLLVSLHKLYTLPPIYITENGAAMDDKLVQGQVQDLDRVSYYEQHLLALDSAIRQGVKVDGYFAWSLMDNFEWAEGYLKRFGIVYVDYQSQQRVIKQSGLAYRDLINSRSYTRHP
jgi:beta-glucosidase